MTTSIGCWHGGLQNFNQAQQRLIGAIDDVRIYNRALSGEEVLELYQIESGISFGNPKIDLGKAVYPKLTSTAAMTINFKSPPT